MSDDENPFTDGWAEAAQDDCFRCRGTGEFEPAHPELFDLPIRCSCHHRRDAG